MMPLKIYKSFKNKAWELINRRYISESSKAYKVLTHLQLLYYSNIQLKKTKSLIIFSIIIGLVAAIDESIVLYSLFNSSAAISFSKNFEEIIKIVFLNIIPILGFIGSLYLLLRRSVGLWLIAIWSSLLIIPIFISHVENGFLLSRNYLNFFNMSPLIHGVIFKSHAIVGSNNGYDYLYQLAFKIEYSPFTSGVGLNFIPIIYLVTTLLLVLQNKKLFSRKKIILLASITIISVILPIAAYNFANTVQDMKNDAFETKKMEISQSVNHVSITQLSFKDRCHAFSRLYFNADLNNKLIKKVSCYNGKEIITFTE